MKYTPIFLFLTFSLLLMSAGCSTDSGFDIQEPTFENVPEPYDISGIEAEPVKDGTVKHVVEEGRGEFQVVIRDDISVFITLRNEDGDIIFSTYQNGRTSPNIVNILSIQPGFASNFQIQRAFTNGLRNGLLGMREGEKRVLFVPPSQGFENIQSGSLNEAFRNDTLRYDIELVSIL